MLMGAASIFFEEYNVVSGVVECGENSSGLYRISGSEVTPLHTSGSRRSQVRVDNADERKVAHKSLEHGKQ